MFTLIDLLLLFIMVFPLMFSPGPTNTLCAAAGAKFGVVRSVPFVIGMDLMVLVPALVVGWGLAAAIGRMPALYAVVRYAGAAVILFQAYKIATSNSLDRRDLDGPVPGILSGVLVQTLNLKGMALLLVIYSQFLRPQQPVWLTTIQISVALTVFSLMSHGAWLVGGAWLASRFTSPRALRIQNAIYAALLVGVAAWMMLP